MPLSPSTVAELNFLAKTASGADLAEGAYGDNSDSADGVAARPILGDFSSPEKFAFVSISLLLVRRLVT